MTNASGDPVARVPEQDHLELTTEIAVRLSDQLVAFIDQLVANGRFDSREAVVTREVRRFQRRLTAEQDADLYRVHGEDPESASIADYLSRSPIPVE